MSTSTRDRILDAAMELFGERGFKATSIVQIETAAGLTPGAGGIYHHFRTKNAMLEAGIQRHLSRLDALRHIRHVVTGLGDLRAELTVLARYALAELDEESNLLRVVLSEARNHPELVDSAIDQLIGATYASFAGWLHSRADVEPEKADAIATVALGGLFSSRLLRLLIGRAPTGVSDEQFTTTWVDMVHGLLTT